MPKTKRREERIVKTNIYFEEEQFIRLKHLAVDERTSLTELVRRAVDEFLKKYDKKGGGKR